MYRFLLVSFLVCFHEAIALGSAVVEKPAELISTAELDVQRSDWPKAEANLGRAIKLAAPGSSDAIRAEYLLGFVLVNRKQWKSAINILQAPHDDGTYRALAAFCLGFAHYNINQVDEAEGYFQQALASNQHDIVVSSNYYLGMIQAGKKELDLAIASFEKIVHDRTAKQPILGYAAGMLAILIRPRAGDEMNFTPQFPWGANAYRLSPDLRIPVSESKFGGSASLSVPIIDTDAVSPPGTRAPDFGRGGIGASAAVNLWAKLKSTPASELAASYLFRANYLFSSLDTSGGTAFDLWSHTLELPYSRFSGGTETASRRIQISPGVTFLQSTLGGTHGIPPTSIFNSYFIRASKLTAENAKGNEEYTVVARYDQSKNSSTASIDSATGPALEAHYVNTRYPNLEKSENWYYGANFEFLPSQGKNYRQLVPQVIAGRVLPVDWNQLTLAAQGTLGAGYFYSSTDYRFDQLLRADLSGTLPLGSGIHFSESLAALKQFSNREIGSYFRFLAASTFSYVF